MWNSDECSEGLEAGRVGDGGVNGKNKIGDIGNTFQNKDEKKNNTS